MCETSEFTGNKTLVCQVGDLKAGDRYRTPKGDTRLVMDQTARPCADGLVRTVSLFNGMPIDVDPTTKLGRDRAGRLYASRSLNCPVAPTTEQTLADNLTDSSFGGDDEIDLNEQG